jgi:hypothetical protein
MRVGAKDCAGTKGQRQGFHVSALMVCAWKGFNMIKTLGFAALAAVLAMPAAADHMRHKHGYGHGTVSGNYARGGVTITVSCYRGPWKEVIIDRPNAVFIDSLVQAGYSYERAHAIGERVCRDEALVDNPGALAATMRQIYNSGNR